MAANSIDEVAGFICEQSSNNLEDIVHFRDQQGDLGYDVFRWDYRVKKREIRDKNENPITHELGSQNQEGRLLCYILP